MSIPDYKIIREKTLTGLEANVCKALNEGFVPTGGLSRITERIRKKTRENPTGEWETITWFIQAMYKRG